MTFTTRALPKFFTRFLIFFLASFSNLAFSESGFDTPEFLKVDQAFQFTSEIVPGGVRLQWQIADHYYLYLERFKFKSTTPNAEVLSPQYSDTGKAKQDPYFGEVHVIHDELEVFLPVKLAKGVEDAELKITYQGCAEAGLCYPPKHQNLLYIPVASEANSAGGEAALDEAQGTEKQASAMADTANTDLTASPAQMPERSLENASGIFDFIQNSSLPLIFGIFFLLGLGLTFTPCVFPMIPIITSIIAGQKTPTVSKSLLLSSAYVLGMAITYATAGVVTGLLGAGANVQAALQDPWVLSVFAAIFVALAMAMFGLYELQLPAFLRDRLNQTSQNLSGGHVTSVFFIGALSALIVSPCVSAPLAGALLYISATADAVIGGISLFALGLGMGVPLILIAVGGGKLFPKAGKWMDAVKAFFGVMLIAVAIWLLGRVLPGEVSMVLWALLLGLSATQMGAFDAANAGWPRITKGLGLLLALYAAMLLIGAASGASNPLRPLEHLGQSGAIEGSRQSATQHSQSFHVINNLTELETALNTPRAPGRPTMVDFYADWCISCKVMEDQVFPIPGIAEKMGRMNLVKADVTPNSAGNQALLNQFGLFGPPSILFFDAEGQEIRSLRIVGEVTAEDFELYLSEVLGSRS